MINNNNNKLSNRPTLIFSQWSRKKYAVFRSLSRVIKIATLSVDTSEGLIKKCNNIRRLPQPATLWNNEHAHSPDYLFLENCLLSFSIFLLLSFTLLPESGFTDLAGIYSSLPSRIAPVPQIPVILLIRIVLLSSLIAAVFFPSEKIRITSNISGHFVILNFKHTFLSPLYATSGCCQDYAYYKSESWINLKK